MMPFADPYDLSQTRELTGVKVTVGTQGGQVAILVDAGRETFHIPFEAGAAMQLGHLMIQAGLAIQSKPV